MDYYTCECKLFKFPRYNINTEDIKHCCQCNMIYYWINNHCCKCQTNYIKLEYAYIYSRCGCEY